jgi:hypothetical protein
MPIKQLANPSTRLPVREWRDVICQSHLGFSLVWILSLTPCFSGVLANRRAMVNRFNGFPVPAWLGLSVRGKPLKRLTYSRMALNTPLKQGVNETGIAPEEFILPFSILAL